MAALILPLEELSRASLPLVGGKAANLGELVRAGFAVPEGFCLTTIAYELGLAQAGVEAQINRLLPQLEGADAQAVASTGAAIRDLVYRAALPSLVEEALVAALAPFGETPLAVRSSATAEDLPEASFAGQQDTYLNVVGTAAVLEAVRRCWASLWTDRAIAYRQRNGIDQRFVALAVVVQRLVFAEAAGVLFTANPVTGVRGQMAIDASLGLGEAVVAGKVVPDSYLVAKDGWRLLEKRLGGKAIQIVPLPGGGTEEVPVGPESEARQALSDEQIIGLARLGQRIEEHFGWPQDVEWALAGGQFHVLQSRPITSLYPVPPPPKDGRLHVYVSLNSLQGMLEPFTPLGASFFSGGVREGVLGGRADRQFVHELGWRLYADFTSLLRTQLGHQALPSVVIPLGDPVAGRILQKIVEAPRLAPGGRSSSGDVRHLLRRYWRRILPAVLLALRCLVDPDHAARHIDEVVMPRLDAFRAEAEGGLIFPQRLVLLERFWREKLTGIFFNLVPLVAAGMASYARSEALVHEWGLSAELLPLTRQGLPNNRTTEMDLDLWALAQQARDDRPAREALESATPGELKELYGRGRLPTALQRGLDAFLAEYGHRGVREIDLGMPRWGEDPTYLFGVLRSYLAIQDPAAYPDRHFALQAEAAEQAVGQLLAEARRLPKGRLKAAMLGFFFRRHRRLGGHRETPKFLLMKLFQTARQLLLGAGEELARAGRLERGEDVVFLRFDELREVDAGKINARQLVAQRRREYDFELRRPRAPRVLTSDGAAYYGESIVVGPGVLAGTGASPGVARGRVRIVRVPLAARLEPGEVLVAPSTDPAWTPLLLTAAGLVMEAGGIMSHGAIVAREYGIPAVVGLPEATTRLADGKMVEVDGNQGLVKVADDA